MAVEAETVLDEETRGWGSPVLPHCLYGCAWLWWWLWWVMVEWWVMPGCSQPVPC